MALLLNLESQHWERSRAGCESVLLSGLHRKRTPRMEVWELREAAPHQHQTAGAGPVRRHTAQPNACTGAVSYRTTDTKPLQSGTKRNTSVIFQFTPSFEPQEESGLLSS